MIALKCGKYRGEAITRVPVGYLRWMVNTYPQHDQADDAVAELDRRGSVFPKLEISGHAIDRASLRCFKIWRRNRATENEGLHGWLARMAAEALKKRKHDDQDRVRHCGMVFVFAWELMKWPVLQTVMLDNRRQKGLSERSKV